MSTHNYQVVCIIHQILFQRPCQHSFFCTRPERLFLIWHTSKLLEKSLNYKDSKWTVFVKFSRTAIDLSNYIHKCTSFLLVFHFQTDLSNYTYGRFAVNVKPTITIIMKNFILQLNGHTNVFWGWGREDSDMQWRIKYHNMTIAHPEIFNSGTVLNL